LPVSRDTLGDTLATLRRHPLEVFVLPEEDSSGNPKSAHAAVI